MKNSVRFAFIALLSIVSMICGVTIGNDLLANKVNIQAVSIANKEE